MTIWPLFDIRIRTPRLELRLPTDDLCFALAEVAAAGIHPPDEMPFLFPWTDVPPPQQQRNSVQHWWRNRADWSPDLWFANFVVIHDGQPIGSQGVQGEKFSVLRSVVSGSWLGQPWQGRGFGKEMRAAVLQFAFEGLGAEWAFSGAHADNMASRKVSEWIGYQEDGHELREIRGRPDWSIRYRLARADWQHRYEALGIAVTIEGLDTCRDWFGLTT